MIVPITKTVNLETGEEIERWMIPLKEQANSSSSDLWREIYADVILQAIPVLWQHSAETGGNIEAGMDRAIAFAANLADKAVAVAKEHGQ